MIPFAKQLADSDKKVRDEAVKALVEYIETQPEIADLEWKKLWKGLFFCFWMSDKTLIQQDLADKLAQVVLQFEKEKALSYLAAFWAIMIREWYRIDRLRLDKYYMLLRKMHQIAILLLAKFEWEEEIVKRVMGIYCAGPLDCTNNLKVPDSLRYHTIENFFVEVTKALNENDVVQPDEDAVIHLFSPFVELIRLSTNKNVLEHITREVLDVFVTEDKEGEPVHVLKQHLDVEDLAVILYQLPNQETTIPQNRNRLSKYLKIWGEKIGIPFVDKIVVTGMKVEEVAVEMDVDEIKEQAKKRKRIADVKASPKKTKVDESPVKGQSPKQKSQESPKKAVVEKASPKKAVVEKASPKTVSVEKSASPKKTVPEKDNKSASPKKTTKAAAQVAGPKVTEDTVPEVTEEPQVEEKPKSKAARKHQKRKEKLKVFPPNKAVAAAETPEADVPESETPDTKREKKNVTWGEKHVKRNDE